MTRIRSPLATTLVAVALVAGAYFGGTWILESVQFARAQEQVQATREQLAQVEDLASVFRQVGRVVEPSVVNIRVVREIPGIRSRIPLEDDLLRRFFPDRDGDGEPDLPEGFRLPEAEPFRQMGNGSGVIMEVTNGEAYILTNNHVAGGAQEMIITLYDGREITDAEVVGTDPKTDLAVIRIKGDRLIPAAWGNSDELQKGDWILAFGSPFGYVGSMTHGIVSALNRNDVGILGAGGYEDFIQVDAPINPGNSGGPLVNIRGEVVGINTAIASRTGGFQGIGFAIPSNLAKMVYAQLRETGTVTRGWLGVSIRDVRTNRELAQSFGFEEDRGVLVEQTFPDTPAYGVLEPGDIIVSLNGRKLNDMQQLRNSIAATSPGEEITLKVFRDGEYRELKLTVGKQPEDVLAFGQRGSRRLPQKQDAAVAEQLGIELSNLTPELRRRYNISAESGAIITRVDPNSRGALSGLRAGHVITRVDNQQVSNAREAAEALDKADLAKGVRLYVETDMGSRFVFIKVSE